MIYATLSVCALVLTTPCKTVPIPLGYQSEEQCFKGGWIEAEHFNKAAHGAWKVEGVGCSPTPPSPALEER